MGVDLHRQIGDDRLVSAPPQGESFFAKALGETRTDRFGPSHVPDIADGNIAEQRRRNDFVVIETGRALPNDAPFIREPISRRLVIPSVGVVDGEHPDIDHQAILDLVVNPCHQRSPPDDLRGAVQIDLQVLLEVVIPLLVDTRHHRTSKVYGHPIRFTVGNGIHHPLFSCFQLSRSSSASSGNDEHLFALQMFPVLAVQAIN